MVIQERDKPKNFPGGKPEPDEALFDALEREVGEEVGDMGFTVRGEDSATITPIISCAYGVPNVVSCLILREASSEDLHIARSNNIEWITLTHDSRERNPLAYVVARSQDEGVKAHVPLASYMDRQLQAVWTHLKTSKSMKESFLGMTVNMAWQYATLGYAKECDDNSAERLCLAGEPVTAEMRASWCATCDATYQYRIR